MPYTHTHRSLMLKDIVVHSVPEERKPRYDARKSILNQCLKLVYDHNILNEDRKSRLKSNDRQLFWSLIKELEVALWLKNQGLVLSFDPPAKKGRKGDFKVSSKQGEAFVEVKTLFGDKEMLGQNELLSKLADYLEKRGLPVSTIDLVSYPCDFSNNYLDILFGKIEARLLRSVPRIRQDRPNRPIPYKDKRGLKIEFELSPKISKVEKMAYGGFIDVDDNLRCKLGMTVKGRECKLQLSTKDIPSIVIICDQGSWSDPIIIEGILYGNRVGTLGSTGTVWYERKRDGRWDNTYPSRLSAVGIFKSSLDIFPSSVDMYLCPNPLYPLPRSLMSDTNIRWCQLGKDKVSITEVSA